MHWTRIRFRILVHQFCFIIHHRGVIVHHCGIVIHHKLIISCFFIFWLQETNKRAGIPVKILCFIFIILVCYILQAAAHFLQASTHFLQHSISCLLHSLAQSSQHCTHISQSASANFEPLAHNLAQRAQMSAQSRHSFTHSSHPIIVKQFVAHFSHSTIQAKQVSILTFTFFIIIFLNYKLIYV